MSLPQRGLVKEFEREYLHLKTPSRRQAKDMQTFPNLQMAFEVDHQDQNIPSSFKCTSWLW